MNASSMTTPFRLPFTKMHGIGNDYVYVNAFEYPIDAPEELARTIADRNCGVGGDGLILIMPPSSGVDADVRMRMFNADGSEAEMCGNGIRCVCKYARDRELASAHPMRVETGRGVLTLTYTHGPDGRVDEVRVDMGAPELAATAIPMRVPAGFASGVIDVSLESIVEHSRDGATPTGWPDRGGLDDRMTCVSMGNPHVVFFCDDVQRVPLDVFGPYFEHHELFPERINTHFVQVCSADEVIMRTWERGSGATKACGTGASAVAVAGHLTKRTERSILAHLPGGDLRLDWDAATDHVFMTGPAVEVFEGTWPVSAGVVGVLRAGLG